ncbi:hypothetical protein P3L10_011712 [Capsicum annuum]
MLAVKGYFSHFQTLGWNETRLSFNFSNKLFHEVNSSKILQTLKSNPVNDEEIVGLETAAEKLIQYFTQEENKLNVIPIVGMGGQGKTTIARILYNNDRIVHHFDVRAWCIISQTYNWRELLQDILSQVTGSKDRGYKDDYLADMLRKSLMRKRYLIVLDDMWDGMAWNDLWRYFRVVGKRSTIIITTRLEKVGEHVKGHINPYYLPFLTTEESCQLLQKKVFQQEVFPPELQVVSQAVAERSNGLPLLVVLVAGIIKRKKMEASWWHKVRNSLCYYLGKSEEYTHSIMQLSSEEYTHSIMQLSYVNLHCHLRPCLLYMGMFPKDVRIPVPALISSWICEGFVQRDKSGKSLEETAEDNDRVEYCQVHDIVLHFCLEKSREEKFMQSVKLQFRPSDGNKHQISLDWNANSAGIARRSFHQNLRSLIMNNAGEFANLDPFGLASKLRLLKVLDLSYIRVRDSMEKLRHVEISKAGFDLRNNKLGIFEESSKLENLRILRGVVIQICDPDSMDVLLGKFPNLQELDIKFLGYGDNAKFCPNLKSLTQLQILRLSFGGSIILCGLQLPSNLKKLVIMGTHIESTNALLAQLESLEYLQLRDFNYETGKWDVSDASSPLLETLVIKRCHWLEEIPHSFAYIPTLKQITFIWWVEQESLKASAVKIKEEVADIEGYDRIDISIGDMWGNLKQL